jgi:hypothetical protein
MGRLTDALLTTDPRQRARLAQRIRRGACGHVIWEFEALKAAPGSA